MKDFDWLILSTLHSNKNISKTAEMLFTSQPNITKRLQAIEEEMKVQVAVRYARGIAFTPRGEYLAKRAEEILQMIEETKKHIKEIGNSNQGTIKIAAPNSFTRNELPGIIDQYRNKNSQVNFQLTTCLSNEIPTLLNRGEIEIGFVHGNLDFRRKSFLLFHEILYIVSKDRIGLEQLPSLSQIDYIRSPLTSKIITDWWSEHFSSPPNIILRVSHGDICCELVRRGLGFGFFFGNNFIGDYNGLNRIIAMKDANKPVTRETWMIYNKFSHKRAVVRSFVEFIKEWKEYHGIQVSNNAHPGTPLT